MSLYEKDSATWHETAASEKKDVTTIEYASAEHDNLSTDSLEAAGFDESATRRLVRKIDWALLPLLSFLYLLSFLDRTNIGNAVCYPDYNPSVILD